MPEKNSASNIPDGNLNKDKEREESDYKNQEGENHSTASEGTLKEPQKPLGTSYNENEEQDLDDLVHRQASVKRDSIPPGENAPKWEGEETDDADKISS
jgi:hypothetical protein